MISFLALGAVALVTYCAIRPLLKERATGVLRVRGLVVEDDQGRERVLLGAPVPSVGGRKRKDAMTGLLVVGENGADRVALGALTPSVQTRDVTRDRIGAATGLAINDENGNERGGFAVESNDDRIVLGMDYSSGAGEAITLGVIPDQGVSISIHDSTSLVRAALTQRNDAPALLYGINSHDKSALELGMLRLSPFATKNAVIGANEGSFIKALDSMKP